MTSTTFESHRWTDEHNDQMRHHGSCSVCAAAEAQAALAATPDAELLTKAYALTHRMHVAKAQADRAGLDGDLWAAAAQTERDSRAARDLITAEVLRRMGDQA